MPARPRHADIPADAPHFSGAEDPAAGNIPLDPMDPEGRGYYGPDLLGAPITLVAAAQRLSQMYGVDVSPETVRRYCIFYRHRMEGRATDQQPPDLAHWKTEDPAPGPQELKCVWIGTHKGQWGIQPRMYLVDAGGGNLEHLELRTSGGRSIGSRGVRTVPRKDQVKHPRRRGERRGVVQNWAITQATQAQRQAADQGE